MKQQINDHEDRVAKLEARNARVESDKAWEVSRTRKIAIMITTYLVVVSYLYFVVHVEPWRNALVPVIGFLLSTLTINLLKKYWVQHR